MKIQYIVQNKVQMDSILRFEISAHFTATSVTGYRDISRRSDAYYYGQKLRLK
jgi:hypothetical protein